MVVGANDRWSATIPSDLLVLVLNRLLSLPDRIRFAAVCRLWRSIMLQQQQQNHHLSSSTDTPLLLTNYKDEYDDDDEKFTFGLLDVCCNRMYKLPPLTEAPYYTVISATTFGWLFIWDDLTTIGLLNPVTGAKIPLPKLPRTSMEKAALSSNPNTTSSCMIACIYGFRDYLGFCRIGDRKWSFCKESAEWNYFHDVIHHNGRFYAVTQHGRIGVVLDIDDPVLIEVKQRVAIMPDPNPVKKLDFSRYLVESTDGEVLVVTRYKSPVGKDQQYKTIGFSVRKLQGNAAVKNLGDQTLFLGRKCATISISASDVRGLKPNCIYFVDDYIDTSKGYGVSVGRMTWEVGIYNLNYRNNRLSGRSWLSPVMWITPTSSLSASSESH